MKKLFLLSAAALMVLASCTKDEVAQTPDQKITFSSPVVNASTKAPVPGEMNETTKYFTNETFSVYALHHVGDYTLWTEGNLYMDNVDCAYSGTVGTYDQTQSWLPELGDGRLAYYWPKDANSKLTFAAYSPTEVKSYCESINYSSTGLNINNLTLPENDAEQFDLMYSERTYNKNSNTTGRHYTGVDINFKHALSQIAFTVASNADYSKNMTIKIQSITIKNIVKSASFAETITDGTSYTAAPVWNFPTTTTKYDHSVTMDETTVTSAKSGYLNKNSIILLPQTVTGMQAVISYTIQHKSSENAPIIPQTATINITTTGDTDVATTTADESTTWMMGKKYIYNIIIGFDKIKFSPEVVKWDVVDNTDLII